MTSLKTVLSAILKDVATAKLTADLASNRFLETMDDPEVLAKLTIPKVNIKELNINLRFAITEIDDDEVVISVTQEELNNIAPENISSLDFKTDFSDLQMDIENRKIIEK